MAKKAVPAVKKTEVSPASYAKFISSLKVRIHSSQLKAVVAANRELIKLYWEIGKAIVEKQEQEGWGSKVLERVAKDLQREFTRIEGFSRANIFRMRAFYRAYSNCLTAVRQLQEDPIEPFLNIPWGHNFVLLDKLKNFEERLWYAKKAAAHGWSRSMLTIWIENNLYRREGKAITNFKTTLPATESDLVQQTLKDPYLIDFITLSEDAREKDIENQLMEHLQKFLVELGQGFAFVGRQYPIKAGKKGLSIDLLFYHLKLRCYVVVELKAREFDSRDAGQMSAYLSAVDDLLRHEGDKPSIGIILCKTKDNVFVEYVLRNFNRPIGVAEFEVKLVEKLPKELKSSLPTVEEIEAELSVVPQEKKKKTRNKKVT